MLKLAATLWKKDAIEKKFNILIQFLFLLSHRALTIYTNTFSTRGALYILGSASIRVWLLLESGFYWKRYCTSISYIFRYANEFDILFWYERNLSCLDFVT